MSETGFGAVSYDPNLDYNDWGFGSPTPREVSSYESASISSLGEESMPEREITRERDTGFGSPYDAYREPVELLTDGQYLPDDGGVQIEMLSDWFRLFHTGSGLRRSRIQPVGPFYGYFINRATGESTRAIGAQTRYACFAYERGTVLNLGLPPLERGDYDLVVTWRDGTKRIEIEGAFTVGVRPRCMEAYRLRNHIPNFMKRGPHQAKQDNPMVPWRPYSEIGSLMQSMGERLQALGGRPTTGLREAAYWKYDEQTLLVETTAGFPESGAFFIGETRFTYTGKTLDSFTGVRADLYFGYNYEAKTEVICDVTIIE